MNQVEPITRGRGNALWIFAIASLLAVSLGAAAMAQADIPLGIWMRNPIAWLVAGALTIFFARLGWLGAWLAPVAAIIVALSLFGPGQEGVHRWLDLGPVQLNAAGLVLPVAIVAIDRARDRLAFPCLLVIAAMLAWQPDISQLAAFSLAAIVIASSRRPGLLGLATSTILAVGLIALCLSRPDPLAAVPHVEGILTLAWSHSPVLASAMAASLTASALSPLLAGLTHPPRPSAPIALSAYLVTISLAPLFGAYPVPLAGYGLSFVIGGWLGIAALCVPRPDKSLTST